MIRLGGLEITLNHGATLYDALYIALAEEQGELLTSDARQAKAVTALGIHVRSLA